MTWAPRVIPEVGPGSPLRQLAAYPEHVTCHARCPCHTGGEPVPDFIEHSTTDTAEHLLRLVESLGDLAAEINQGAEASVTTSLDALIRVAVHWRQERDG